MSKPVAGFEIEFRCVVVILGIRRPFVLDVRSRSAEPSGDGVPMPIDEFIFSILIKCPLLSSSESAVAPKIRPWAKPVVAETATMHMAERIRDFIESRK